MTSNYIKKVAMIGAGGNSGSFIAKSLLEIGKHTLTALTRQGSTNKLPEGALVAHVDYDKPETFVEALKGQDALIMTLGASVPHDKHFMIIQAAADAGVPWILPNEWGSDTDDDATRRDLPMWEHNKEVRDTIKKLGKSAFISVSTGYWYEWSLAIPPAWGFDFENKTVTFIDDGNTKISVSTWPQVGRAVAGILSLPIKPEGGNPEACLDHIRNKSVFVNSFTISQQDMLQSVLRVTGDKESDWTIVKEDHEKRFLAGKEEMQQGSRAGFAKMIYTRILYPDGVGNFEKNKGTLNAILGLPEDDIDEATARAIERTSRPMFADVH